MIETGGKLLTLEPLITDAEAEAVLAGWRSFAGYGQYSEEGFDTRFAPALAQRYDAVINFLRTGGRFGRRDEPAEQLLARTNYFRETYVYGEEVFSRDLAFLMHHDRLLEAARELHGRAVIEPSILYANVMVPGQELAVHTDVPEFRGANRKVTPQWLLVVMRHSGLFESWRMPIATGICYFGGGHGGALAYWPEGALGDVEVYTPLHNTGVMLDTDSVFHGVDRVEGDESRLGVIDSGQRIVYDGTPGGAGKWTVFEGDTPVATFDGDEIRLSISWKAYCFADEDERDAWRSHTDDVTLDLILDRLDADLRDRGRLEGDRPDDVAFAKLLIEEYVSFPGVP
ncbi:MAG TPA: hypothetical protein VI916_12100 [Acidimicrobiia bacterium]|nr:hypothetical protein [Acidimicrobiia bacterium]